MKYIYWTLELTESIFEKNLSQKSELSRDFIQSNFSISDLSLSFDLSLFREIQASF